MDSKKVMGRAHSDSSLGSLSSARIRNETTSSVLGSSKGMEKHRAKPMITRKDLTKSQSLPEIHFTIQPLNEVQKEMQSITSRVDSILAKSKSTFGVTHTIKYKWYGGFALAERFAVLDRERMYGTNRSRVQF